MQSKAINLNQSNQNIILPFIFALLLFSWTTAVFAAPLKVSEGYLAGADGNQIFHRVLGDGEQTIIYLHGGPGFDMHDGGYELDPLAQTYRVIVYDQRGGGHSQLIEDPAKMRGADHVEDLEAIRKHFKLQTFTLMGLSWGSGLAMLYANKYPQHINRMIMLSPMPISQSMIKYRVTQTDKLLSEQQHKTLLTARSADLSNASDEQIIANCRLYIPIIFTPYMSPLSDWKNMKGDLCGSSPQGMKRRWGNYATIIASLAEFDWSSIAKNYHGPVYILEGQYSAVPLNTTREWAAHLPNAQVEFIKNAGHIVWLDNPADFIASVRTFMQGQWPQNSKPLNPTHLNLLARYAFNANIKNDMDNRFDGTIAKPGFGTDRFGNPNSTAAFAAQDKPIMITKPDWAVKPKHWSWSGWFKVERQLDTSRTLLAQGASKLGLTAATLNLSVGDLQISDTTALTANQWFHVGVVQDNNALKLYRDGQLVAAGTGSDLEPLSGDFTMHNRWGDIDDVRIYAGALTPTQMQAVYHQMND